MSIDALALLFMAIVVFVAIAFGLFTVLRQVALWYFRIDEIVELLKKQTELLETIATNNTRNVSKPVITPTSPPVRNPLTQK